MPSLIQKIGELAFYMKFGKISTEYFGHSSSWLYQRINGYDGNGKPCDLTPEQTEILKKALHDVARRIDSVADSL